MSHQEGSNCVTSTSLHWNKCRAVRGSPASSTAGDLVSPTPAPFFIFCNFPRVTHYRPIMFEYS